MNDKPTYSFSISEKKILVYDNLFSKESVKRFYDTLCLADFTFLHSSRNDTVQYREWAAGFSVEDFKTHQLHELALGIAQFYSEKTLCCYDVFSSASSFGDMSFIHNDSSNNQDISVLYYANNYWEPEWGGETIFYTDSNEAEIALSVIPGRLVVFNGGVKHRAGIPNRICPEIRLTLSMRFESV